MNTRKLWIGIVAAGLINSAWGDGADLAGAVSSLPADYFAEPTNLPYDEEVQQEKQGDGWHWKEFRYTSLVCQGEPTRIHAIYALPGDGKVEHKLPAILMTHGIFGYSHNQPYWYAIEHYARAGYAVLFVDWYPDYAASWKPTKPNEPIPYTTFGKLDYLKPWVNYWLMGNDWKDSLPYQFTIAAERGVTWLQARPEVDGSKIGATGASYGGIFSSMLAGIEPRIKAVNPCVYTAGFGKHEASYNHLPEGWTEPQVASWKARFDSRVLLAKRSLPILYTVGSADPTFLLTKAMDTFAAMNEPKHLLIGPNRGHDYWEIEQGILFFDHALKQKFARPAIHDVHLGKADSEVAGSATVSGDNLSKVEFYFTSLFEIDPDAGPQTIPASQWKWIAVESKAGANGSASARWTLPIMRPADPKARIYHWGTEDILDLKDPKVLAAGQVPAEKLQGIARLFVRVTDGHGAMECSPITEPVTFSDPAPAVAASQPSTDALPALVAAARIKTNAVVEIHPDVPAGQPMATFEVLPTKGVGTHGYVLWNWQQKSPSSMLTTNGVATPTMKILAPFADSVKTNSFEGAKVWGWNSRGGLTAFKINGVLDTIGTDGRSWHGSVAPGMGGTDEVSLEARDDEPHLLTVVVPTTVLGECNVRVSVRGHDGVTATVMYRHTSKADALLQFRCKGSVSVRVQITSQPTADQYITLVGPSAIFLD